MENRIPAYAYPGIPEPFQEMIIRETVRPDAMPLYDTILNQIELLGGKDLTLDYLLLENQKQFGFQDKEIRARIRSRIWALNYKTERRKRGLYKKVWCEEELSILYIHRKKRSHKIAFFLNVKGFIRTFQAINKKKNELGYFVRKRKSK